MTIRRGNAGSRLSGAATWNKPCRDHDLPLIAKRSGVQQCHAVNASRENLQDCRYSYEFSFRAPNFRDTRRSEHQAINWRVSVLGRWKFAGRSRDGGAFKFANDEPVHRNGQRSAAKVVNFELLLVGPCDYQNFALHGVVISRGDSG